MAAVIPFTTIEGVIAALAKIDVMHRHMAQSGDGKVPDEYFLAPLQIHVVSQGDDLLWDGATKFVNSETLRFKVGDSVKCLVGDAWFGGVVVRQPIQDGEAAAYDILLSDGRRLVLNEDSDSYVRAGDPRAVSSFELIFAGGKVRKPHDDSLASMGDFGRDVQLVDNMGPPEVVGRMVASLKPLDAPALNLAADDALYEKTLEAAAGLIGAAVPANWQEQRAAIVQAHWPPIKKRQRGRPPAGGPKDPAFFCPVEGCGKAYASYGGLYLHKRAYHPELINRTGEKKTNPGPPGAPGRKPAGEEKEPTYFCPAPGCNKAYGSYGGLYLHKRSHHPELISKTTAKTDEEKAEAKRIRDEANRKKKEGEEGPKKPANAYLHFTMEQRPLLALEQPELPISETSKVLGEKWQSLEDKSKYELLAQEDVARYQRECAAMGFDPDTPAPKRAKKEVGELGEPKPKRKKAAPKKKPAADWASDEEEDDKEYLPWAVPPGMRVASKPLDEALVPCSAEAKKLVGRSMLYHWEGVGWCSGVVEKANGDKSKTVDGDMVNFLVYYEMDDDLSRHVLENDKYEADGPANSWVLLEADDGPAPVVAAEVVEAVADQPGTSSVPAEEMAIAAVEAVEAVGVTLA